MKRTFLIYTFIITFLIPIEGYSQDTAPFRDKQKYWVDSVFTTLSLKDKIGQLFMVAAYSNRDEQHRKDLLELIGDYGIGGLIFFQGGPVRQARLTNEFQSVSEVPLLIAMDAEWGLGMRLDSTVSYPYQMGLGAIEDEGLIYQMGTEIAGQFRRLGMHINFAPVIDVNNNARNPVINFRSFGEDKHNVVHKGLAYMKGLQDHGVLASGKHFPGHGDTDVDSHLDLPVIGHDWGRLKDIELYPFKELIREGLGSIMVAHLNIPALDPEPGKPSTLSSPIVTGLLKDSLAFEGIVFTDALNMKGVTKYFEPGEIDLKAFQAGNDILLFSENVPKAIELINQAVSKGEITVAEIDQRVMKILELKFWSGLHEYEPVSIDGLLEELNTPQADLLLRKLIGASTTALKNDGDLLPLKRLDTLTVNSLTLGQGTSAIFQDRLDDYIPMDHYRISNKDQYHKIREKLDLSDLTILNIEGLSQYASRNFGLESWEIELANEVIRDHNTIFVWHGNPYGLDMIENVGLAKSVIITYQERDLTKDMAAQLIFGGISASGTLPVTINDQFPAGTGIVINGGIRFGYTIPEAVDLDSKYLNRKLDSLALYALQEEVAPGLEVLVARDQKIVFHKTFGYHTYDKTKPVREDDLFDFASVTKITGALPALMKLYDQGEFDLEASLADYIRYYRWGNKRNLTIRRILSHNAGLQSWIPYWKTALRKNGKFKWRTLSTDSSARFPIKLTDSLFLFKNYKKKIYRMIRKSPVDPDQGYVYSGLSFYLWPEVIENITGNGYEPYLKDNSYRPLGAYTLTYNPHKHFSIDQIVPTEKDTFFRKIQIHGVVHDEGAAMMDGVSSNAGLFGTAQDLAKLMQMYLNMGEYGGRQYISSQTMKIFTACHYCNEKIRRGLAFDKPLLIDKERGLPAVDASDDSFGHSGYTGTFTWADPETGILFVFLSNRVYPTRENNKIAELSIRPKMHQVIYDARR